jgi:hypothetical protein
MWAVLDCYAVGLDLDNAWAGMSRDIDELRMDTFGWVMLFSFALLPLASLILLGFRRWIAVVPLLGWLTLLVLWVLYYATDWFPPISGGSAILVFFAILVAWFMLLPAAFRPSRRRSNAMTSSTTT